MTELHKVRLPAGWYPDPEGGEFRRWWDGKIWTPHTAPFQKPAPVYDVDDLAEKRARTAAIVVPAPRRIRTAARLGRSLAALAHKLPLPHLPHRGSADAAAETSAEHPAPQGPTTTGSTRRAKAAEASPRVRATAKATPRRSAPKTTDAATPAKKPAAPKKTTEKAAPRKTTEKKEAPAKTAAASAAKKTTSAASTAKKPAASTARKAGRHAQ